MADAGAPGVLAPARASTKRRAARSKHFVPPPAGGSAPASVAAAAAAAERDKQRVSLSAGEVAVLVQNASLFGTAERGLWHFSNLRAAVPRRLWLTKDSIAILSASGVVSMALAGAMKLAGLSLPPPSLLPPGAGGSPTGVQLGVLGPAALPPVEPKAGANRSRASIAPSLPLHPQQDALVSESMRVWQTGLPHNVSLRLQRSTTVKYMYAKYRLVVAVDTSPSMFALDVHSVRAPFHDVFSVLASFFEGLVQPMLCTPAAALAAMTQRLAAAHNLRATSSAQAGHTAAGALPTATTAHASAVPPTSTPTVVIPPRAPAFEPLPAVVGGTSADGAATAATIAGGDSLVYFVPEIHISIIALSSSAAPPLRLLVHGFSLASDTVGTLMRLLSSSLRAVEEEWSQHAAVQLAAQTSGCGGALPSIITSTPTIMPLLECAVYTLKLLPSDACASIVLVSDGVLSLPTALHYGSVVIQLLRHDISVHVLQLGTCSGVHAALGRVPDTDALQYLALSSGGFRVRQRDIASWCSLPPAAAELQAQFEHTVRTCGHSLKQVRALGGASMQQFTVASCGASGAVSSSAAPLITASSPLVGRAAAAGSTSAANAASALPPSLLVEGASQPSAAAASPLTTPALGSAVEDPLFCFEMWSLMQQHVLVRPSVLNPEVAAGHDGSSVVRTHAVSAKLASHALLSAIAALIASSNEASHLSTTSSAPIPLMLGVPGNAAQSGAAAAAAAAAGADPLLVSSQRTFTISDYAFPWSGPPPQAPFFLQRIRAYAVAAPARQLLECRLKEGFRLLPSQSSTLQASAAIKLVLPWQSHILIVYSLLPVSTSSGGGSGGGGGDAGDHADNRAPARGNASARQRSTSSSSASAAPVSGHASSARQHATVQVTVDVLGRLDFVRLFMQAHAAAAGVAPSANPGLLSRLTAQAVELASVRALAAFIACMHQVDMALIHLSHPPDRLPDVVVQRLLQESEAAAAARAAAATAVAAASSTGVVPTSATTSGSEGAGGSQAAGAVDSGATNAASRTFKSVFDRRRQALKDAEAATADAETLAQRNLVVFVNADGIVMHAAGSEAVDTLVQEAGVIGAPNASALAPALTAPSSNLRPELALFYAPFAALSLSAWHRWFDVERFELYARIPPVLVTALMARHVDESAMRSGPARRNDSSIEGVETLTNVSPTTAAAEGVLEGLEQDAACVASAPAASATGPLCAAPVVENSAPAATRGAAHLCGSASCILECVQRLPFAATLSKLRAWADAELPSAATLFSLSGSQPPCGDFSNTFLKCVGSDAPAASHRGKHSSHSHVNSALSASAGHAASVVGGASVVSAAADRKTVRSAIMSTTAPPGSSVGSHVGVQNSSGGGSAGGGESSSSGHKNTFMPFLLIRVARHAHTPALIIVHVAVFGCTPPERVAHLDRLRALLSQSVPYSFECLVHQRVQVPSPSQQQQQQQQLQLLHALPTPDGGRQQEAEAAEGEESTPRVPLALNLARQASTSSLDMGSPRTAGAEPSMGNLTARSEAGVDDARMNVSAQQLVADDALSRSSVGNLSGRQSVGSRSSASSDAGDADLLLLPIGSIASTTPPPRAHTSAVDSPSPPFSSTTAAAAAGAMMHGGGALSNASSRSSTPASSTVKVSRPRSLRYGTVSQPSTRQKMVSPATPADTIELGFSLPGRLGLKAGTGAGAGAASASASAGGGAAASGRTSRGSSVGLLSGASEADAGAFTSASPASTLPRHGSGRSVAASESGEAAILSARSGTFAPASGAAGFAPIAPAASSASAALPGSPSARVSGTRDGAQAGVAAPATPVTRMTLREFIPTPGGGASVPPLGVCSVAAAPRSSPDVNDSLTLSPSTEQRTRVAAPQSAGSVDTEADASVQSSVRRLDWSTDDAAPDVATAVVDKCADGGSCAEAQPAVRVVSKYVKQRADVEVPISVTVCPVSRILISPSYPRECADCCAPPALTHTVSSSSSSSSSGGGGGSGSGGASTTSQPSASMFLSELGEDAANTLLCCGGTSIPQAHLAAMLWRRHWQYRVRVAGRASMAEEVLHMAVSRLISTRADDQWVLLAWDVLPSSAPCNTPQPSCASAGSAPTTSDEATQHTTTRAVEECDDEDVRAPHATCASVAQAHPPRLRRALFMKVVDVARVHSSPAHELRCSRANEAVSHVFRTTCVLQQEVRVDWPAGAEAGEGRVWINFWVEPQDGFSLGTRASASKRTILSTRALYTMYANAIYASDVDILRSELHMATVTDSAFATGVGGHDGSVLPQPGACTPTLEVHAFDALNHTVDVRGEALLRVSQAHTVTSSGAQRAAAAAAQPAFATAVPAHLQLLTQASHSSSGSLNSGSMSAMAASRVGQGAPPPMSNVATAALPHLQLPSPPPLLPGFELRLVPQQPLLGQIIAPRTATAAAASGCAATLCAASDVGGASCVWPVSRVGDSQFGAIASVTWHASEQGMMREQRT